jgi:hypothetical protein
MFPVDYMLELLGKTRPNPIDTQVNTHNSTIQSSETAVALLDPTESSLVHLVDDEDNEEDLIDIPKELDSNLDNNNIIDSVNAECDTDEKLEVFDETTEDNNEKNEVTQSRQSTAASEGGILKPESCKSIGIRIAAVGQYLSEGIFLILIFNKILVNVEMFIF